MALIDEIWPRHIQPLLLSEHPTSCVEKGCDANSDHITGFYGVKTDTLYFRCRKCGAQWYGTRKEEDKHENIQN